MKRVFCVALLSLALWAQGQPMFQASLSTHQCSVGDTVVLELRLSGATETPGEPDIPDLPGLSVESAGTSNNFSVINGITNNSSSYTFVLTPVKPGAYTIPAISIQVGAQRYSSRPMSLTVGAAASAPPGPAPAPAPAMPGLPSPWGGPPNSGPPPGVVAEDTSEPVLVEAEVSTRRPYVNQLVVYTFRFLRRVPLQGSPNFEPPAATGFLREDMGQKITLVERNGRSYSASEVRTAFFPTASGRTTIGATRLTCAVVLDSVNNPSLMFEDPVRELTTQPIDLEVLPLPTEGKPPSFQGAVGSHFELSAQLPKNQVRTGEAARLNIQVRGDEHPDLIPEPALPHWKGLRVYTPEAPAAQQEKDPYRSIRNFRYPLVAQQAGTTSLAPISFSYFDPEQKRYRTLTAPVLELSAAGPAQPGEGARPAAEATPGTQTLAGPDLGFAGEWSSAWAGHGAVPALAGLPWLVSLGVLAGLATRERILWQRQTHGARLRRAIARVRRARALEDLAGLAYEALEVRHERPLTGIPLAQLRELLPAELVDRLQELEALRYAPEGASPEGLLEGLRRALLAELEAGL